MQLFYIVFLQWLSVTRAILDFYRKNIFFAQFLFFCKWSLDQFYSISHVQFIYIVYHNVHPSYAQFLRFLFLAFLQKNFLYSFLSFCKFSYLNQLYIFPLAIILYLFYHNVHRSHVQTFKFLPFVFL